MNLEQLQVEVTDLDCKMGVRGNQFHCVVVNAVERLVPQATRVVVRPDSVRFSLLQDGVNRRYVYPAPQAVTEYCFNFDQGTEPHPMTFTLKAPEVTEVRARDPRAPVHNHKPRKRNTGRIAPSTRLWGGKLFKKPGETASGGSRRGYGEGRR